MSASSGVDFLRWALPLMGLRWAGFRRPRGQVLKRIRRRCAELGLQDLDAYRRYLEQHAEEWAKLEQRCRVTITRFYRDRGVFDRLRGDVLPTLAKEGARPIRCWSAGCASGEEPYTLALIERFDGLPLSVLATDADAQLLERAERARYPRGALKELPGEWVEEAFEADGSERRLERSIVRRVTFRRLDLRRDAWPDGPFEVVLCRNLAFTYFDESGQRQALEHFADRLVAGGALVVGSHETVPEDPRFEPWHRGICRRRQSAASAT